MTRKENVVLDRIHIAVEAAQEKQAGRLELLDLRGVSGITDYFLICDGKSQRQVQAIVEQIDQRLRAVKARPNHIEGDRNAEWVLMDYLDFVIHVFTRDRRDFYGLEKLWSDAPRLDLVPSGNTDGTASRRSGP